MSVFARLKKAREEKKGFTLVELIVVLVILAILAAILVPALLGWIDEARKKQYVLEARNVYIAVQTVSDEAYVADEDVDLNTYFADDSKGALTRVATLADVPLKGLSVSNINKNADGTAITQPEVNTDEHKNIVITQLDLEFTAQKGDTVTASLKDGKWTVDTKS